MKKTLMLALTAFSLVSCSAPEQIMPTESSTVRQEMPPAEEVSFPPEEDRSYVPLNYPYQKGVWLPYVGFDGYITGRSGNELRTAVREKLSGLKELGFNTVYFHVRPFGDAYYSSEIFPPGTLAAEDTDVLAAVIEEAHDMGLSVHAWINPLRLQSVEEMAALPDSYITKKWSQDGSGFVREYGGRYYLVPAFPEVIQLISDGVSEIIENYDVDGIHIDDYFYPTTEEYFDSEAFAASGSTDLAQWRRDNCTALVKSIYDTVKAHDSRLLFGISPQGSISANTDTLYADVVLWSGSPGYCDYIVPQVYFGFKHETHPFTQTVKEWGSIASDDVALIIGIGAYKTGKPDEFAGIAGEAEWTDEPDIVERQIQAVLDSPASGYAIYY